MRIIDVDELKERLGIADKCDNCSDKMKSYCDGNPSFALTCELICKAPTVDAVPVSEIEKIIESLQEQADIYNSRAQELLVEEDGQVSQYTWAVSLRETYRRIIKTLDDLIS